MFLDATLSGGFLTLPVRSPSLVPLPPPPNMFKLEPLCTGTPRTCSNLLPSAMNLDQGNIFRSVCQELCSRGEGSMPRPKGEVEGLPGGVSRPTPGGCLDPGPEGRFGGLAGGGGGPRPTPGGGWGVWLGGSPGPHPGRGWGVWLGGIPACTKADTPSRWLLQWAVRILLECIFVYYEGWQASGILLECFLLSNWF